jgi:putative addiction module antidote
MGYEARKSGRPTLKMDFWRLHRSSGPGLAENVPRPEARRQSDRYGQSDPRSGCCSMFCGAGTPNGGGSMRPRRIGPPPLRPRGAGIALRKNSLLPPLNETRSNDRCYNISYYKEDRFMVALKVRAVGNSVGVILPQETLAALNVAQGDTIFLTPSPDGYRVTPYDPTFERQMKVAQDVMKRDRHLLRELAK